MVTQSTLRSRGFRIARLTGNQTRLSNDKPFTVNGKPAPLRNGEYTMRLFGWFNGPIDRIIEVSNND